MCFPVELQGQQAGRCFGASIGLGYPIGGGANMDLKVGVNPCNKEGSLNRGEVTFL